MKSLSAASACRATVDVPIVLTRLGRIAARYGVFTPPRWWSDMYTDLVRIRMEDGEEAVMDAVAERIAGMTEMVDALSSLMDEAAEGRARRDGVKRGGVTDDELVDFIAAHAVENCGMAPTVRDVCVRFGWGSTSTAHNRLHQLERAGRIRLGEKVSGQKVTVLDE